jgi:hypothetical protein
VTLVVDVVRVGIDVDFVGVGFVAARSVAVYDVVIDNEFVTTGCLLLKYYVINKRGKRLNKIKTSLITYSFAFGEFLQFAVHSHGGF